ncbi:MAG: acyltransferase family protein, partial [Beijerinckiaceae bacterium]
TWPDLKAFAIKRAWRIAPAYYAVLLVTLFVAAALLLPHDVRDAGKAALSAAVFASNFYFTNTAGYFAGFAIHKPFLHTWSLAVEVQFYLIWPLLFLAMRRATPLRQAVIVALVSLASFILSVILTYSDDKVAFYALPSRLWEFGLGALVALAARHPPQWAMPPRLGGLGALLILIMTPWLVSDAWAWPAPAALIPVLATAFIIFTGNTQHTLTGKLLSAPPLVAIGRISYSLYLVHWPVAVALNYIQPPMPSLLWRITGLALSFALAIFIYRVIEKPARALGRGTNIASVKTGLLAAAPVVAAASALLIGNGLGADRDDQAHMAPCAGTVQFAGASRCIVGDGQVEPDTIVWGDSHAQHFAPGFGALLKDLRRAAIIVSVPTCPPALDAVRAFNRFRRDQRCAATNAAVLAALDKNPGRYDVYLAARWAFYAETVKFGREHIQRVFLVNADNPAMDQDTTRKVLETGLRKTLHALGRSAARVTLIEQVPEMGFDAGQCVRVSLMRKADTGQCNIPVAMVQPRLATATRILDELSDAHPHVRRIKPQSDLCDDRVCYAAMGGHTIYSDGDHLTRQAAEFLVRRWQGRITQ